VCLWGLGIFYEHKSVIKKMWIYMIFILFGFGKRSFLLYIWVFGKCTVSWSSSAHTQNTQTRQTEWIFRVQLHCQYCINIAMLYIFGKLFKNAFQWYNFRFNLMIMYLPIRFCLKKDFNTWSADYKVLSFLKRESPISLSSYIKRNPYHCLAFFKSFHLI